MQNGINLFRFLRKPYDYVAGRLPRPTFTLDIILKLLLRNKPKIAEQIYNCITGFEKKKREKVYNCATTFEKHTKNSR